MLISGQLMAVYHCTPLRLLTSLSTHTCVAPDNALAGKHTMWESHMGITTLPQACTSVMLHVRQIDHYLTHQHACSLCPHAAAVHLPR